MTPDDKQRLAELVAARSLHRGDPLAYHLHLSEFSRAWKPTGDNRADALYIYLQTEAGLYWLGSKDCAEAIRTARQLNRLFGKPARIKQAMNRLAAACSGKRSYFREVIRYDIAENLEKAVSILTGAETYTGLRKELQTTFELLHPKHGTANRIARYRRLEQDEQVKLILSFRRDEYKHLKAELAKMGMAGDDIPAVQQFLSTMLVARIKKDRANIVVE